MSQKRLYRALCTCSEHRTRPGYCGGRVLTGWVYRVGNTGPPTPEPAEEPTRRTDQRPQGAGPARNRVGRDVRRVGGPQYPPLRGPVGPPRGPPWYWDPWFPASWPIRARFHVNSCKVSQNGQVSPGNVEKACHSPCFQNGLAMSPLDFLGFPF